MRILLFLPLLLTCIALGQEAGSTQEDSLVVVLDFKYLKSRQTIKKENSPTNAPAPDMIAAKNIALRNPRPQGRVGAPDPNTETIDARSAALEKNVQESLSPSTTHVDGYAYQTKIRNAHTQNINVVFWEYQFKERSNPTNVVRRQFLCSTKIKPGKERELLAFSALGPSDVISVDSLTKKSGNLFEEKVVINRVEYADGSILQRKDWNFAEVKLSIERAIRTPWGTEMCRSL
ncbi:MAG TPA: hypothetical protein VF658_06620 [Pyrinomonadaceae bacterium]|jgi:hypothetical protein